MVAKVERNEPCPCKSGKKFKKCCGQATPPRRLSVLGFQKVLMKFIMEQPEGEYEISFTDLGFIPMDKCLAIKHDRERDVFQFKVVDVPKPKTILTPGNRIIAP